MPNAQGFPLYGEPDNTLALTFRSVTYVLSQEEYNRYGAQSVTARVTFVHTPLSVDLQALVNVPSAVAKSAQITGFSITSNVVMFTAANSFSNGDVVAISGLGVGTYLNGQNLTVMIGSYLNASGQTVVIPSGQFAAGFTHADVGSTADSGTAKQVQANLTPLNVSYDSSGFSKRAWYVTLGAPLPAGLPW